MFRVSSLSALALVLAMFVATSTEQVEAGHWRHGGYYASGFGPAFFHDYSNYGGRYHYRPYGSYYGYYGVSPTYHGWTSYYGGWNTYAPYAYSPSLYSSPGYGYYPSTAQFVSYGSTATVHSTAYSTPVSDAGCFSCSAPSHTAVVSSCAPTCCSATVAYGPGTFCRGVHKKHCGILGPLCPFKRWGAAYGTCGSFGYGGACGW